MSLELLERMSGDDDRPILGTNVPRLVLFIDVLRFGPSSNCDSSDRSCTADRFAMNLVDALDEVSSPWNWRSGKNDVANKALPTKLQPSAVIEIAEW